MQAPPDLVDARLDVADGVATLVFDRDDVRNELTGTKLVDDIERTVAWINAEHEIGALVVTEIGRDGTMEGPDVDQLTAVLAATTTPVIASGGVGDLADLLALAAVEVDGRELAGAIVGRAIYEGRLSVTEALEALDL